MDATEQLTYCFFSPESLSCLLTHSPWTLRSVYVYKNPHMFVYFMQWALIDNTCMHRALSLYSTIHSSIIHSSIHPNSLSSIALN
jgi:hypothetical protein